MSAFAIQVKNLSKVFTKKNEDGKNIRFYSLKNLNFDIKKGSIVGVVGENGSGKSTLLKILGGILKPTNGIIEVEGKVGSILDIGTGMHPELTGKENIFLKGELLGMEKEEINEKYSEIVTFSGVHDFINMPIKNYSSGMFLRLAFSVLIYLKSDVLLLDEVLSVGDADFQKKCIDKLIDISHSNRTILIVSHQVDFIAKLTEKTLYLQKGEIISFDNTTDVLLKMKKNHQYLTDANNEKGLLYMESEFNLKSFKILNDKNVEMQSFSRDEPIFFEIEYSLFGNGNEYCFGFVLQDESNSNILSLHNFEVDKKFKTNKGSYKIRWEFPKAILSSKTFFCEISIAKNNRIYKKLNKSFDFHIKGKRKVAGYEYKPSLQLATPITITELKA